MKSNEKSERKSNTKVQQEIRQRKKDSGIVTVTLELKRDQYEELQKLSQFLCQGNIKEGQKGVISVYTNLFIFLLEHFNQNISSIPKAKSFYRRCSIAKFYKFTSKLKTSLIIEELNKLKIKKNKKLKSPQCILNRTLGIDEKQPENWNIKQYRQAINETFIQEGIEKIIANEQENDDHDLD
ncbi:hypothetical protein [uncultured Gilliamella sp.]|uniref:hypothetical protein n=1 Tax=uncultured Gilliamella sp. TaxID=1193505 RepID=UPI0025DFD9A4|nr:hypothetical protein [uncultured Gilliamella sp.]